MISFWEREHMLEAGIAIIGGGITGLSVACSIKEKRPNEEVTVFERSVLPYGASTRNAGFACFGSLTEVLSDIRAMGEESAADLIYQRWKGLEITRKRLGDRSIDFQPAGGFELIHEEQGDALDHIHELNRLVADFIPNYFSIVDGSAKPAQLIQRPHDFLVQMEGEGQVNTGKLMRALEMYALKLGVRIRSGCQIEDIESGAENQVITITDQFRKSMDLRYDHLVVCTNAFTSHLFPKIDITPGRGQVFITKPIKGLMFRGNVHVDEGYYYLRNVDNRLLFGGGRNLDFDGEATTDFKLNESIQNRLELILNDIIQMPMGFEVDMRWSGIMAFGADKNPIIKRINNHITLAAKMGGMGVALAGQVGDRVAQMIFES